MFMSKRLQEGIPKSKNKIYQWIELGEKNIGKSWKIYDFL